MQLPTLFACNCNSLSSVANSRQWPFKRSFGKPIFGNIFKVQSFPIKASNIKLMLDCILASLVYAKLIPDAVLLNALNLTALLPAQNVAAHLSLCGGVLEHLDCDKKLQM